MKLDDYQQQITQFDTFQQSPDLLSPAFLEKVLGLSGEAGEVADKIKKIIRDDNARLTPENKQALAKELGDTLWYLATIARYLDLPLSQIAQDNISKLQSRQNRGKLHGSGDNR